MTNNILAESSNYRIEHAYEAVYLCIPDGKRVLIGDFYGDPEVALIDADEKWCVVGGCGLIIYAIIAPFDEYECEKRSSQYVEIKRQPPDVWWVREIRQLSDFEIELTFEDATPRTVSFANFDLVKY